MTLLRSYFAGVELALPIAMDGMLPFNNLLILFFMCGFAILKKPFEKSTMVCCKFTRVHNTFLIGSKKLMLNAW